MTLQAVGQRLRAERVRLGVDQTEFAKWGGVSKNSQGSYEAGRTPPTVEYLLWVGEHGVDIGYVLTGERANGSLGAEERLFQDMLGKLSAREREAVMTMLMILTGNTVPVGDLKAGGGALATLHDPATSFRHQSNE
ncbi:XRE family transcriptional regulator [Sphingomonas gilva]|uniref:XRE family transcriptional regulator n=1 Tax=Sphingomonas gilva TaxID=2305907 RepID=A0A396RPI6_9SPHN|nr:helix-turn-helix transcriptional regulator [Sphingomonas gilva]RHW17162.1 XRE family transcriptional regulator [Sphingomonas gilva]